MADGTGGIEGQLYDIDATLGGIVGSLERICEAIERMSHERNEEDLDETLKRIATALERMAPQGSERERIALQLYVHVPMLNRAESFERADAWIAERDRQRVRQAE